MSFPFECPHCGTGLSAAPGLARVEIPCPDCGRKFPIPRPEDVKVVLDRDREGPSKGVKFLCPFCDRKLSATPDQFGTEMPCPFTDCQKPVLVPNPEWKTGGRAPRA